MKTYAPNYYKEFHCIAGACRHSCCVGWDVYIDEETLEKYRKTGGDTGKLLRARLQEKEDGVCFCMLENGRCPFLNERGLCDIILEKGEDFISEICREHPRFYSFFSDRTEVGLGLSCEEAARIILSQKEKTELAAVDEDGEAEDELWESEAFILGKREEIFGVLQDRSKSVSARAQEMLAVAGAKFPKKSPREWADILRGLEIMDPAWEKEIGALCSPVGGDVSEHDTAFEKLLIYFIYRHTAGASGGAELAARVCFAYLGFIVIRALCSAKKSESGECTFADVCDFARRYSAEIEYSPENTETLISLMEV